MLEDKNLLKPATRHLGGVNIGFLDGHASWWNSERLVAAHAEEARTGNETAFGLSVWGPTSVCGAEPDVPTIY